MMCNDKDIITLKPIGVIKSDFASPDSVPIIGGNAVIEVFPEYKRGLLRIEENSHLWLQMWFHEADRSLLSTVPGKVNSNLPEYGVFSIRAVGRPNPVALSLVRLERVENNLLYVSGLDAIDGTFVLDIKPYYEQEIVFSPSTPYIRPLKREMRQEIFIKQAMLHHQEKCAGLLLGVRMALIADDHFGHLNSKDLKVTVNGPRCLADVLQGLSNARLSNPPRFRFTATDGIGQSIWEKGEKRLTITAKQAVTDRESLDMEDDRLFSIDFFE
ncbi:tRNA (N6-threonylcarbamoyladenosine(37)-N6)-methyltransferase TrmO [Petroclostridium sp. X23]|uniref:tRNA (N6-threonylcarbamoyladenosine(37)-N6)-methyltransferase TrmO n=1 Tax=Petroclostridium sp. X23 TaxID=3045146 RepID=UPI0024AE5DCF|nr:tRNA (N6-threonylcarbamoyladenosine(37)-N6)-methyltransferase TrmO [Petroclostridium sp. X23]WHH61730.1 tRNA (N6-threonylcarbamoyladenosine(37)-N6)-methyltransferase TrmO [Petroclostridium sp. X23]